MDGLDDGCSRNSAASDVKKDSLSSAAMLRKSNKPLMEKRRRERINNCLDQLKNILMEVTKKESSYYSKLEKADILEMTVKYLNTLKRQHATTTTTTTDNDNEALCKYVAGFNECAKEVTQYLTSVGGDVSADARTSLLGHLADSLQHRAVVHPTPTRPVNYIRSAMTPCQPVTPSSYGGVESDCSSSPPSPRTNDITSTTAPPPAPSLPLPSSAAVYVINPQTGSTSPTGPPMQLLPARLPTGEIVFLLTTPPSFSSISMNMTSSPSDVGVLPVTAADSTLQSPQRSASTPEVKKETKFCIEPSRSTPATSAPVDWTDADGLLVATSSTDDDTSRTDTRVPLDGVPKRTADVPPFTINAPPTVSGSRELRPMPVGYRLADTLPSAKIDDLNDESLRTKMAYEASAVFDVGAAAAAAAATAAADRANNNCPMDAADGDQQIWRPW